MHEIILENDKEIVLDAANKVFVGPNGSFKIVIDRIANNKVTAWHIEDRRGNKSPNLAASAKGEHIDLVVGINNRTTAHFFNRQMSRLYQEFANTYGGTNGVISK